jgi:hypothetical protein
VERFPLRRAGWALPFLALFAPRGGTVDVDADRIRIRLGLLGRADIPVASVVRISEMNWPWWGGAGVRIGRELVAFAGASGRAVVFELEPAVRLRAPLTWTTRRVVVVVERPEHLAAAVAAARQLHDEG